MATMEHEDGYCDSCGCQLVDVMQLTIDGDAVCNDCATRFAEYNRKSRRVERDNDGR
jgi:uncharacterized paraquat-inducible protein A